jgi:hypothetical protein
VEEHRDKKEMPPIRFEGQDSSEDFGLPRISEPRPRRRPRRPFNPSGKDALFSVADTGVGRRMSGAKVADGMEAGRDALFDGRRKSIGIAGVECSSCGRISRVTWLELLRARIPISLWIPFRSYDHFMRCPSCGQLTWTRVSLFG